MSELTNELTIHEVVLCSVVGCGNRVESSGARGMCMECRTQDEALEQLYRERRARRRALVARQAELDAAAKREALHKQWQANRLRNGDEQSGDPDELKLPPTWLMLSVFLMIAGYVLYAFIEAATKGGN